MADTSSLPIPDRFTPDRPTPPAELIEDAAFNIINVMRPGGWGREAPDGEREILLVWAVGRVVSHRTNGGRLLEENHYFWAVKKLVDAGLARIVEELTPPKADYAALVNSNRAGRPARDAAGKLRPEVAAPQRPALYLRSTPALWPRYEAERLFNEEESAEPTDEYVTLSQIAASVSRSKRTLEKREDLPPPDVEGGGGKPHEWRWSRIRPWLVANFERKLPERFFTAPPTGRS